VRLKTRHSAFTLAELLVAILASVIIIGALFVGSIALQKTSCNSERFSTDQSNQRLLMDYVGRDLRRAVGIATQFNGGVPTRLAAGSAVIEKRTDLVITLPAYYKSNIPKSATYDEPLPIIASGDRIAYGSTSGPAPDITILFRKITVADEACICFVREEAGSKEVLVRQADDLHIRITIAPDGRSSSIAAWFRSTLGRERPAITVCDQLMLRNLRID
jgi:Tfp pilus assembly protein PilW